MDDTKEQFTDVTVIFRNIRTFGCPRKRGRGTGTGNKIDCQYHHICLTMASQPSSSNRANKDTPNRTDNGATRAATVVGRPGPNDVLMGRGAPVTEHEGNNRLRQLVMDQHSTYAAPHMKRIDKQRVAMSIVQSVRERGGTFLRRLEAEEERQREQQQLFEGSSVKSPVWEVVTDEQEIMRKIKELLRDMGPEARQKRAERHRLRCKNPPKGGKRSPQQDHSKSTLSTLSRSSSMSHAHSVHSQTNALSVPLGTRDSPNYASTVAQSTQPSLPLHLSSARWNGNQIRSTPGHEPNASLREADTSRSNSTMKRLLQSLLARMSATPSSPDLPLRQNEDASNSYSLTSTTAASSINPSVLMGLGHDSGLSPSLASLIQSQQWQQHDSMTRDLLHLGCIQRNTDVQDQTLAVLELLHQQQNLASSLNQNSSADSLQEFLRRQLLQQQQQQQQSRQRSPDDTPGYRRYYPT